MIKKILVVIGIILLIFILTNPTMNDFENYSGGGGKREMNYLVLSIYSKKEYARAGAVHRLDEPKITKKYLGIIKNFFEINN
jgi:hypothetical protein